MTLFIVFHQFIRLLNGDAFEDEKQSFCHIIHLQFCHFISICLFSSVVRIIFLFLFPFPFHSLLHARAHSFITKKIKHFKMSHFEWCINLFACVFVYCVVLWTQFQGGWNKYTQLFTIAYYTLNQLGLFSTLNKIYKRHTLKWTTVCSFSFS